MLPRTAEASARVFWAQSLYFAPLASTTAVLGQSVIGVSFESACVWGIQRMLPVGWREARIYRHCSRKCCCSTMQRVLAALGRLLQVARGEPLALGARLGMQAYQIRPEPSG